MFLELFGHTESMKESKSTFRNLFLFNNKEPQINSNVYERFKANNFEKIEIL